MGTWKDRVVLESWKLLCMDQALNLFLSYFQFHFSKYGLFFARYYKILELCFVGKRFQRTPKNYRKGLNRTYRLLSIRCFIP